MRAAVFEAFQGPITIQNINDPAPKNDGVVVKVNATEKDTLPDVGTTTKTYTTDEFCYKSIITIVNETRGPGLGKSAKVEFQFVIKQFFIILFSVLLNQF